jgi:hypothetical protein
MMTRRRWFGIVILAGISMGVAGASPQTPASSSPSASAPLKLSQAEIALYKRASTLVDWSPSQVRSNPYLRGVRIEDNAGLLPVILQRVGQSVTLLFKNFPQVTCDESVSSDTSYVDTLRTHNLEHYPTVEHKYHYIVLPLPGEDLPGFEEYRTDLKGVAISNLKPTRTYMLTSDFASISLYLRPADQPVTRFRYFGTQAIREHACHVIGFAQDPMRVHRAAEFSSDGRRAALLVQGLAWVDAATFEILRMKIWLLAPRDDIGLNSQVSTVEFYPVIPAGSDKELWLPGDVSVEIEYQGADFRNTHHYSDFRLFRVEITAHPPKQ